MFTFDYVGIDRLQFDSFVLAGQNPEHFAMDDLRFNEAVAAAPVPLPVAAWAGMVLMGMVGANRLRRRRADAAA